MDHRLRPDIKNSADLSQAVDHTKLRANAEAMVKTILDSGYVAPEHYADIHRKQLMLLDLMAENLCCVLPATLFISALQQIAKQEHPTRGGGPAAWVIAKEVLEKFNMRGDLLGAIKAFDDAVELKVGDAYVIAARVFFGETDISREQRNAMKTILFGHIYGKGGQGLKTE